MGRKLHLCPFPSKSCLQVGGGYICFVVRGKVGEGGWRDREGRLTEGSSEDSPPGPRIRKNHLRTEEPGENVTSLCSKGMTLRPGIKNTLAALLLCPWKLRAQRLFSPTVPDTIWPHVKQSNNCVSSRNPES